MDNKPRFKIILDEFWAEGVVISVSETQDQPLRVASAQEQGEPCRSGRVVLQSNHFMVWKSLLTKFLEEPETDPYNYNKVIQDKDVTLWQKAMKIEMESMFSKSSLVFYESTWWGKTHRLQVSLQEKENDR